MAFLGKRPASATPNPTSGILCPHCGKDTSQPPTTSTANADPEWVKHLIVKCNNISDYLTAWEQDFLESVSEQYTKRGTLSDKQITTIQRIYDDNVKAENI